MAVQYQDQDRFLFSSASKNKTLVSKMFSLSDRKYVRTASSYHSESQAVIQE